MISERDYIHKLMKCLTVVWVSQLHHQALLDFALHQYKKVQGRPAPSSGQLHNNFNQLHPLNSFDSRCNPKNRSSEVHHNTDTQLKLQGMSSFFPP